MGWSDISKASCLNLGTEYLSTEGIMKEDKNIFSKAWDHFSQQFKDSRINFRFTPPDISKLETLVQELKSGARVSKSSLSDDEIKKVNELIPSLGLFNVEVGGDFGGMLKFFTLLQKLYSPHSPYMEQVGAIGEMFTRFGKEEKADKALQKNNDISNLIGSIKYKEFVIHPNSDEFITATISRFFQTSLSITSVLKTDRKDDNEHVDIRIETDVIKDLPTAKVTPLKTSGAMVNLTNLNNILKKLEGDAKTAKGHMHILYTMFDKRPSTNKQAILHFGMSPSLLSLTPLMRYLTAIIATITNYYSDMPTLPNKIEKMLDILAPKK